MAVAKKGLSLNVQIKKQQVAIAEKKDLVELHKDELMEARNQLTALVAQKQKGKR